MANACQTMLTHDTVIKQLARENMSLAETVADALEEIAGTIREAFESVNTEEGAIFAPVRAVVDEMDAIAERWADAVSEAVENYNAERTVYGEKNTAPEGGERRQAFFEKDKYFENQINQWEKKADGARIKVGELHEGSALNRVGFPAGGMWFDVGKIKKSFGKHGDHLTKSVLKQIPTLLNDPIAITEYRGPDGTIDNTVNVFGLILPDGKTPVVVGVMMTKARNGVTIINKIRTIHAHGNAAINDDNILYLNEDKKRTRKWFQVCGNSVPLEGNTFGLIRSIAYVEPESNSRKQVFDSAGNELTEEQQRYFADSKIRDADGRLKVMYRGGEGDFTVFDRKKSKYSNLYGRGFYFTDSKEHAQQYGNARAFYLNITHPLQAGTKTITKPQLRAFLEAVAEDEDYGLDNYGQNATVSSVLRSLWGRDDSGIISDINASCIGDLVAATELFNEVNGTDFDGIVVPTEVVTFRSEQAKLTSNENPTENPDIRFQRFDATDDDTATEAQGRRAAYDRLQNENAVLRETVSAVKKLNTKQGKTIEALQKRLHITKTPETRLSDARKRIFSVDLHGKI